MNIIDIELNIKTLPVYLLDFYADYCGPCKALSPILDDICSENNIFISKINTESQPDIAAHFKIIALPTLILFRNGIEVKQMVGLKSKKAILEWLKD